MALLDSQLEFLDAVFANQIAEAIYPLSHLRIYQNNIISNFVNALRDTYPLIEKLLGKDFFRQTAKVYFKRYPSRSGNLHDCGEYFSSFLRTYPLVSELFYLSEIAQFEWTCHTLFFAAFPSLDETSLDLIISSNQYDQLHLGLHPVSQLLKCDYPLLQIIDLCQGELNGTVEIDSGGVKLLVIRRYLDISLIPLTDDEFAFLSGINENLSITDSLKLALKANPQFELNKKLAEWIKDKVLVNI